MVMECLVRMSDLAMTLTAPIWFCCAFFRMSTMICFSCFCSDALSRSSSRMALSSNLLFSRRISTSCFRFRSATSRSRRAFLPWARFLHHVCFVVSPAGVFLHRNKDGSFISSLPLFRMRRLGTPARVRVSRALSLWFSLSSIGPTSMSVLHPVRVSPFFVSVCTIGCGPGMGFG